MPQHPDITRITDLLLAESASLAARGHRQMVILSGSLEWAVAQVSDFLSTSEPNTNKQHSVITPKGSAVESLIGNRKHTSVARPDKPNTLLGYENSHAVFDAYSGFNPDALCAISGTIIAGGLLFILTPPLDQWPEQEDLFAKKRTSFNFQQKPNSPQTIKRFLTTILNFDAITISEHQTPDDLERVLIKNRLMRTADKSSSQKNKPWQIPSDLTNEQHHILTTIFDDAQQLNLKTQEKKHRQEKSFHIIQADRGRGKSHLIGLLAHKLINTNTDNGINIILTGPSKISVQTAYESYNTNPHDETPIKLNERPPEFVAPENVLSEGSEAHILLVDEAASLPIPLLKKWAQHFQFIVFATTTHGYEGTGKGFQIRFLQFLKSLRQSIHQHNLTLPIRYNHDDPIENGIFKAFCLDSEPRGLTLESVDHKNIKTTKISQAQLHEEPQLLEEVFSLLVQAHYQTRPSDLRDILDAPGLSIFISYQEQASSHIHSNAQNEQLIQNNKPLKTILAACLAFDEGNLNSEHESLVSVIIEGKRRPKGHLIPQVLTLHLGQENVLYLKGGRIVRIATLPNLQRLNMGSDLLNYVSQTLEADHYDYIGSSYADTTDVREFWLKNDFNLIRLGNKLDQSSGTRSGLVIKGLSQTGNQLVRTTIAFFENQSLEKADYQQLSHTEQKLVHHFIESVGSYEAIKDILSRNESWKFLFKDKRFPKKAGHDFRALVKEWSEY